MLGLIQIFDDRKVLFRSRAWIFLCNVRVDFVLMPPNTAFSIIGKDAVWRALNWKRNKTFQSTFQQVYFCIRFLTSLQIQNWNICVVLTCFGGNFCSIFHQFEAALWSEWEVKLPLKKLVVDQRDWMVQNLHQIICCFGKQALTAKSNVQFTVLRKCHCFLFNAEFAKQNLATLTY